MSALTRIGAGEGNPFRPTLPDTPTGLSEEGSRFFREQTESLRLSHTMGQAGDTTFSWELLTETSTTRLYNPGAVGRFYHHTYGILLARYVQFTNILTGLSLGAPFGLLLTPGLLQWRATNDLTKSHADLILGLGTSYVEPREGEWGWVLIQGVNLHDTPFAGGASQGGFDRLVWAASGSLGTGLSHRGRVIGSTLRTGWTGDFSGGDFMVELGWDSNAKILEMAALALAPLQAEVDALSGRVTQLLEGDETTQQGLEILRQEVYDLRNQTYTSLNAIGVSISGANATIEANQQTLLTIVANNQLANVERFDQIAARYVTADSAASIADGRAKLIMEAAVSREEQARADADGALAVRISLVEASGGVTTDEVHTIVNARVYEEEQARVTADEGLGIRIDTVEATYATISYVDGQITTVAASVTDESIVRARDDEALASQITTVSTTVDGHTAAITVNTASINGIEARWGVTIDVNGSVSGIQLLSGVGGSLLKILVDSLQISNSAGVGAAPFRFEGNILYLNEAVIKTLRADQIILDGLTVEADGSGYLRVKPGGINTPQLAPSAAVLVADYEQSGSFVCSTSSIQPLVLNSQTAQVTVANTSNYAGVVFLSGMIFGEQNGSTSDSLNVYIYNGASVIRSWIRMQISSGSSGTDVFNFQISLPLAALTTATWQIRLMSNDTTRITSATMHAAFYKRT